LGNLVHRDSFIINTTAVGNFADKRSPRTGIAKMPATAALAGKYTVLPGLTGVSQVTPAHLLRSYLT
jgi:hypothetical protein